MYFRIARPRLRCKPKRHSDFIARCYRAPCACVVPAQSRSEKRIHLSPVVIACRVLSYRSPTAAMQAETALGFYCPLLLHTMYFRIARPKPQRKPKPRFIYCPLLSRTIYSRIARPRLRCKPKRHSDFIARCYRVPCACVVPAQNCSENRIHLSPVVIAYHVFPYCSPKAAAKTETAFHLSPVVIAYHVLAWYPPKAAAKSETAFHLLPIARCRVPCSLFFRSTFCAVYAPAFFRVPAKAVSARRRLPCRAFCPAVICPCAWLIIRFAAGKIHLLTRARPLHAGVRAVESKTGDSTHGRVVAPQPISGFVVDNAVPDVL